MAVNPNLTNLRFCPDCNSALVLPANGDCNARAIDLLYPKVDKVHHVLQYACRSCPHEEETPNPCVYRNDLIVLAK
jgi:DNA-directed RNA polymerase subunit M/transcription elongation factor TFIIS